MDNSQIGSNHARDNFADVLTAVEHGGAHFTVMRYKKPAVVIVPVGWYERARALLEANHASGAWPLSDDEIIRRSGEENQR